MAGVARPQIPSIKNRSILTRTTRSSRLTSRGWRSRKKGSHQRQERKHSGSGSRCIQISWISVVEKKNLLPSYFLISAAHPGSPWCRPCPPRTRTSKRRCPVFSFCGSPARPYCPTSAIFLPAMPIAASARASLRSRPHTQVPGFIPRSPLNIKIHPRQKIIRYFFQSLTVRQSWS